MAKDQQYPRIVVIAAYAVAIAAIVYAGDKVYLPVLRPVLSVAAPFAIAFVLAFLLNPVVTFVENRGSSRGMAVALVSLLFLVVFVAIGFLLIPRIVAQSGDLASNFGTYTEEAKTAFSKLLQSHQPLLKRFHLPTTPEGWSNRYSDQFNAAAASAFGFLSLALGSVASKLMWIIIIPLATLWFLRDLDYIRRKVVHFTPKRHQDKLLRLSSAIGDVVGSYLRGMLAVAILYSGVASVILGAAGLPYGLVIGAVSGFLYLVPYVGVLITVLVTALVALVVEPTHSATYAGTLIGILCFTNFIIFDQIVTPKIVGGSVGVHPVIALFALALGAQFGVVGMMIAVPVAACVQVAIGQAYPRIYDQVKRKKALDDVPVPEEDPQVPESV